MNFNAAIDYLTSEHIDSFLKFNEAIISVIRGQYEKINPQKTSHDMTKLDVEELKLCFSNFLRENLNEPQKQNLYEYFEFIYAVKPHFDQPNKFNHLFSLFACVSKFVKENHKSDFTVAFKNILTQNWSCFSKEQINEMQEASQHSLISPNFCYSLSESLGAAPRIRVSLFIYEVLKESTEFLNMSQDEFFNSASRDGRLLDGLVKIEDKEFSLLFEKIVQAKDNQQSGKFKALEDLMNEENVDLNQIRALVNLPDQQFKKSRCCSMM